MLWIDHQHEKRRAPEPGADADISGRQRRGGLQALDRKELYEWTQATLCGQGYLSLHRSGKGLVKQYISKVTGLSRAQATRLITQYVASGIVQVRR
ncbi:MAG: hypothetical protein ACR2NN_29290, partial [Bryobacteraceae bacterium]